MIRSEKIAYGCSNNKIRTLLSFDEFKLVIEKDDSTKLKEVINKGLLPDINMKGKCLLSLDNEQNHPPYPVTLLCVAFLRRSVECVKVLFNNGADMRRMIDHNDLYSIEYMHKSGSVKLVSHLLKYGTATLDDKTISCSFERIFSSPYDNDIKGDQIAAELIPYITDLNYGRNKGGTFLTRVCSKGKLDLALALLERGADCDAVDYLGNAALHYASEYGHLAVVKLLLDWDKSRPVSLVRLNRALVNAVVWGGQLEVLRILTEYGANAHTAALLTSLHSNVYTYLSVPVATFLLDHGADVRATDWQGYSALSRILVRHRYNPDLIALATLLLERGADPNEVHIKSSEPLLLRACTSTDTFGSTKVMITPCEHGADVNPAHGTTSETPLMKAALMPNIKLVRLLLKHGADVNQTNLAGQTVLDLLAAEGEGEECIEIAQLCMERADSKPVLK